MATPEGRRMAIQLPCRRRSAWLLSYHAGGGKGGGRRRGEGRVMALAKVWVAMLLVPDRVRLRAP
jgi:hypothetical protein